MQSKYLTMKYWSIIKGISYNERFSQYLLKGKLKNEIEDISSYVIQSIFTKKAGSDYVFMVSEDTSSSVQYIEISIDNYVGDIGELIHLNNIPVINHIPHKCDTQEQVFLYEQEFYVLSNFSSFEVKWKDIWFKTSEHAYHWEKFHRRPDIQLKILTVCRSAHEVFALAQTHKQDRDTDFDIRKFELMYGILYAKTKQHPYVMKKLLETGNRQIIEDSWRDDIWGWGPAQDGQNQLGELWMSVRDQIRKENAEST